MQARYRWLKIALCVQHNPTSSQFTFNTLWLWQCQQRPGIVLPTPPQHNVLKGPHQDCPYLDRSHTVVMRGKRSCHTNPTSMACVCKGRGRGGGEQAPTKHCWAKMVCSFSRQWQCTAGGEQAGREKVRLLAQSIHWPSPAIYVQGGAENQTWRVEPCAATLLRQTDLNITALVPYTTRKNLYFWQCRGVRACDIMTGCMRRITPELFCCRCSQVIGLEGLLKYPLYCQGSHLVGYILAAKNNNKGHICCSISRTLG